MASSAIHGLLPRRLPIGPEPTKSANSRDQLGLEP
jgi:hypothetical protein